MYPQAEVGGHRMDSLDPENFTYTLTSRESGIYPSFLGRVKIRSAASSMPSKNLPRRNPRCLGILSRRSEGARHECSQSEVGAAVCKTLQQIALHFPLPVEFVVDVTSKLPPRPAEG